MEWFNFLNRMHRTAGRHWHSRKGTEGAGEGGLPSLTPFSTLLTSTWYRTSAGRWWASVLGTAGGRLKHLVVKDQKGPVCLEGIPPNPAWIEGQDCSCEGVRDGWKLRPQVHEFKRCLSQTLHTENGGKEGKYLVRLQWGPTGLMRAKGWHLPGVCTLY